MVMQCSSYKKVYTLKCIIILFVSVVLFQGCSRHIAKQPYSYPNYNIIKPKITCKPNRKNIQKLLFSYLGKPYVWAEEGPNAFDCSGLTYNIYGKMGITIPRTASEQAKMGKDIPFEELQYGDLIFFGSSSKHSQRINHVGIYLGNGWFAHASSKDRRVIMSHFQEEPQYFKRIKHCKRYISLDERYKYMSCDVPLKKMKVVDSRYTTPWKRSMGLPSKAIP